MHPFYQSHKGWNQIQYKIYSALGDNCQRADGNSELAVQFFRNLILLAHQFEDVNKQRECLTASLTAFRKFEADKEVADVGQIGYVNLPEILPHTVEVYVDHEKIYNNLTMPKIPIVQGGSYAGNQGECDLIEQKYINFNGHTKDDKLIDFANKEAAKVALSIQNEDVN